ncbi:3-beta-hydroxysteroid dehydrogenase [Drechslerella dactyloides]|uniref:3-beta-hydroxysteroid dehydrogenase n=1 Tax=Drechslerella dactyloides TaxID=74499 RepID=A0AAD6NGX3_DREDA|nr:3-beta-hydroxysteroid dehydrogenase [Drechslerella dactyloides]
MSAVALILGAGANIGHHVGRALAAKGYKVVLASRSAKDDSGDANTVRIQSDLSDPDSVVKAFATVRSQFGHPSVVVYNAAAATPSDPKNPFSISTADFTRGLTINITSVFVAAQQAVIGFKELPASASKTFIYTGNCLNEAPLAPLMDLGVGKSATAHMIRSAAEAFKDQGFKFYYADERTADGGPAYSAIDGPAHGKLYAELAEGTEQGPWQQTFVKGVGYKQFPPRS